MSNVYFTKFCENTHMLITHTLYISVCLNSNSIFVVPRVDRLSTVHKMAVLLCLSVYRQLRSFIGDFTLTSQYFALSLSVNCHDDRRDSLLTNSMQNIGK